MATTLPADLPPRLIDLPPRLIDLLHAEGVSTLEAWQALGRRRRQIFGVTRAAVAQLDALVKASLPGKRAS